MEEFTLTPTANREQLEFIEQGSSTAVLYFMKIILVPVLNMSCYREKFEDRDQLGNYCNFPGER